MRAGGCTVQQPLTPEAAAVVKQAMGLARCRGHAQVTPLHVASTMLSSSGGLLRSACLRSHSHPFQCKALELCFNVALNRLPASSSSSSSSSPLLGGPHYHHPPHHHQHPSLSNALVAAFKRAQAHQRRGSVETHQQPLLAVKIELGQLIVSILDDPSVSRVMREAGFSSTQVKANVLQAVSVAPATNPSPSKPKEVIKATRPCLARGKDVTSVVDCMASGTRRSVVVVGDSLASAEGVVKGVIDRVEKGDVPEDLKSLRFITLPLFSFRNSEREEVEQKVGELRRHVGSCCAGIGGAVLYLGDLSCAAEYWSKERGNYYCPVEHVIMEIKGLLLCGGSVRFWVMGISTYETYIKCRVLGNPSLEALLGLQALTFPSSGLELSLNCDSDSSSTFKSKRGGDGPHWPLLEDGIEINQLTCCGDCSMKFETEARALRKASSSSHGFVITSTLPSWLQQFGEENNNIQDSLQHLYKKWNSICDSAHGHGHGHPSSEITLHLSSISPSSSSVSSYDCQPFGHTARFSLQVNPNPNPNPNPNANSTSSSDTMETECPPRFKEINSENLKILCSALEKKVPWQKTIIPEIASAVLQCRSGMMRRKERPKLARAKEGTWLFFEGGDVEGKEKIARELANLIFGSHTNLVSIGDLRNKRSRSEANHSHVERLFEALRENPLRVFLVEDIEQADSRSQIGIKAAIQSGRVRGSGGEEVGVGDAIIILSCESFDSKSRACSPPVRQRMDGDEVKDGVSDDKEIGSSVCLDLNLCAVDDDEGFSFGDMGIADSVDRAFFFKLPEDL